MAPSGFLAAVQAGAKVRHHYTTVGLVLNLPSTFGEGWVFGSWHDEEADWFASSVQAFLATTSTRQRR